MKISRVEAKDLVSAIDMMLAKWDREMDRTERYTDEEIEAYDSIRHYLVKTRVDLAGPVGPAWPVEKGNRNDRS